MNIKFPNFNFDEWIKEYIVALLYADVPYQKLSSETIESEKASIDERKEFFYDQNHSITDEYWCQACEYSRMLSCFNEFMEIASQKNPDIEALIDNLSGGRNINKKVILSNILHLLETLKIGNDRTTEANL